MSGGDMKVCMLTTGFPRFKGDLFGSFILELSKSLRAQGVELVSGPSMKFCT